MLSIDNDSFVNCFFKKNNNEISLDSCDIDGRKNSSDQENSSKIPEDIHSEEEIEEERIDDCGL